MLEGRQRWVEWVSVAGRSLYSRAAVTGLGEGGWGGGGGEWGRGRFQCRLPGSSPARLQHASGPVINESSPHVSLGPESGQKRKKKKRRKEKRGGGGGLHEVGGGGGVCGVGGGEVRSIEE